MARYLKSIILQGFKSFPIRTSIELIDGITGIVGANGSGKSNIVESVRWVLGEQSAKSLRGEKMEDIIFNGTRNRLPSSMAEVTLVFDNESKWLPVDYSEVEVTRRMFRSGECQYFINRSKVRLKDIVELFLDTGIGRDSYAIFEQGKIDRLLSESPLERRTLFEEFAGISKFKFRKEEAEKKLEISRQNLQRVDDMILNLQREAESLKSQAEVAKEYNELKNQLRDYELRFEALRARNFISEIEEKARQREKLEVKLNAMLKEIEEVESSIIEVENRMIEFENINLSFKDKLLNFEKEWTELRTKIKGYEEKKSVLNKQLENLKERLSYGEKREKIISDELSIKKKEYLELLDEKESLEKKFQSAKNQLDEIFKKDETLKKEVLRNFEEMGYKGSLDPRELARLQAEILSLESKEKDLRNRIEEKKNEFKIVELEIAEAVSKEQEFKKNLDSGKNELENIVTEINEAREMIKRLRSENKTLTERIESIRIKMKEIDTRILEVLDKQTERVKSFIAGKKEIEDKILGCIENLKVALSRGVDAKEFSNALDELVNYFEEYKIQYEGILGIIYRDEDGFLKKLEYQKELEEIEREIADNNATIERQNIKLQEFTNIKEELQKNYQRIEFEYNAILAEKGKKEKLLQDIKNSISSMEASLSLINKTYSEKKDLYEKISKLIETYEKTILSLQSDKRKLHDEINSIKLKLAMISEKLKSLQTEIKRIENELEEYNRLKVNYEKDQKELLEMLEGIENEIEKERKRVMELEGEMDKVKRELEASSSSIEGLDKQRKLFESRRKEISENIKKLEKTLASIENAISERRGFLESVKENVKKTYNVEVEDIIICEGDNFDLLSEKISEIREKLQALGDVNFLAIEQYQDTKERLDFLYQQKNDIEKAIKNIEDLINETNEKSKEKFSAAFEDIRKAFKKVFARLFDGGRADLILEDRNDVLNSGINIMAEPPGKKFQSISLLSGGERALVAIAVIFSILYLKPTPFVILDEMDAPLDDDNIDRFKSLLGDFKETSQFIIVSHSKSTLEICDALYGVTMEEQGVSKVVSVAFDEAEKIVSSGNQEVFE